MDDSDATQPMEAVSAEDATQVMPPADEPVEPVTGVSDGEGSGGVPPRKVAIARVWFAVAVIAVLLAAVAIGVFLGTRKDEAPEVAETTEVAEVVVPDLRGMTLERATQDAEALGLTIGESATAVVDESVTPAGTVLSQDPLPGAKVEPGSAIVLVIAEAPAEPPAADTGGTSGTTPSGSADPAVTPPPPPDDVSIADLGELVVAPRAIDLSIFQLQQWTTVLEHTGTAEEWTSGTMTLGAGEKRILLTADGPNGYLVGVWSWDAVNDTDWHLESIVVSAPGGATFETVLDAPAGNHTFMVKSNNTAVLWTVKVQEKK
ncbi:MAG: PASTA domain-containing protein [Coriobacteriia bacterium]|nr:PASTA domain-containing protein [Coriobacteriia bacterium]